MQGDYPIVEGVLTTSFYGKGVAIAGMKTSCGAVLIATQFTDTVEVSSGATSSASSSAIAASSGVGPSSTNLGTQATSAGSSNQKQYPKNSPDEQVRVIDFKTGTPIPDLAYYIEAPDGSTYTGHTDADGLCERVKTYQPEELTVCLGEDAENQARAR